MSIYAVFETGGKQYRVQPGDIVEVEKLEGDVGATLKFDRVLMTSEPGADASKITLGKPMLSGATVEAEIVGQGRGEKIFIVKMKRRKQYRRTQGHRQFQTQLLITGVANGSGASGSLAADAKKEKLAKFYTQLKPVGKAFDNTAALPRYEGESKTAAAPRKASPAHGSAKTTAKKSAGKKTAAKKTSKKH